MNPIEFWKPNDVPLTFILLETLRLSSFAYNEFSQMDNSRYNLILFQNKMSFAMFTRTYPINYQQLNQ